MSSRNSQKCNKFFVAILQRLFYNRCGGDTMTTGTRIRNRRKELGISADELASRIGVNRSTIFRYENGDIEKLPMTNLEPIAAALDTTVDQLMGWDKTEEQKELEEYLEQLKNRPEMKMLFKLAANATKEDVEQAVRIIEAIRKK